MPILAGRMVTEPPELPEEPTPPTPVWFYDPGTITASWIDPDGTEWPLSLTGDEPGWFTVNGPAGWGATPVELVTDPLPRGGDQVRFIRSQPRKIQWPLYIGGEDHMQFVTRYRSLMRAFTKTSQRGAPGWLRIRRPNGRYRTIAAYYQQGFEGDAGENHLWAKPVITLYCPDGYWSSDQQVRAYREIAVGTPSDPEDPESPITTPQKPFLNPFMTVSSSKIISGGGGDGGGGGGGGGDGGDGGGGIPDLTTISNTGDVEAWPVWTLRGPMTRLVAENITAGARFALTHTLLAEQTITITTNRPTVRGPGDVNLTGKIDWFNPIGTELWPLLDGPNEIRFRVDGAGPGTRVDLVFTPRFETA